MIIYLIRFLIIKTFNFLNNHCIHLYNFFLKECIKPVEIKKTKNKPGTKIKIQDDGSYAEILEVNNYQV